MHPEFCILKLTPHTSHLFLRATRGMSLGRNSKLPGDTFIWYEQKSKEKATKRIRRCVTRSFYNMCQGCHYRVLESGSRASKGLRPPLNSWQQFLHCIVMASKGLVTTLVQPLCARHVTYIYIHTYIYVSQYRIYTYMYRV